MSVLLTLGTTPHGSEGPVNALPLAEALSLRGEGVEVFLIGDAARTALAGRYPCGAPSLREHMTAPLLGAGVESACRATCCAPRGLSAADLVADVPAATIHDLSAAVARCDKVVSS